MGTRKKCWSYTEFRVTRLSFKWGNEGNVWESCTSYAIIRVITVRVMQSLLYIRFKPHFRRFFSDVSNLDSRSISPNSHATNKTNAKKQIKKFFSVGFFRPFVTQPWTGHRVSFARCYFLITRRLRIDSIIRCLPTTIADGLVGLTHLLIKYFENLLITKICSHLLMKYWEITRLSAGHDREWVSGSDPSTYKITRKFLSKLWEERERLMGAIEGTIKDRSARKRRRAENASYRHFIGVR